MYTEARKISLIRELLKVNNDDTLEALEHILKNAGKKVAGKNKKASIYDFVGILTKKEADSMRTAIEETCETIYPDDWK